MINELKQGETYFVPFVSPYTNKGPYSIKVSAIAKKSTLEIYGDFDIRGTFFDEVGIKTYLTMVTDETDIYICHKVTSFDPAEIKTDDFIFIPKSIIDFQNVEKYKETTRFKFMIEGVRRRFDTSYEQKQFIESLEDSIPDALRTDTILANDVLSISNEQEELLVREGVLKLEEDNRNSYIKAAQEKKLAAKRAESEREMDYYRRMKVLAKSEEEIEKKQILIEKNYAKSQRANIIANKWLASANDLFDKIKIMYEIIVPYATSSGLSILSWEELLNKAYSGISLSEWKGMLELVMKNGQIPDEWKNAKTSTCPFCNTKIDELVDNKTTTTNP